MATFDWRARAVCRDEDPELFFPAETDIAGREAAQAICARCPVQAECGALGRRLRAKDGVWGGQYRGKLQAGRGRPPAACGTPSGYRRHLRLKEPTCELCRLANNAATKDAPAYRAAHAERKPAVPKPVRTGPPKCQKLTAEEVRAIREASSAGQSARSLALRYSMSPTQICKIIRREAWANV